MLLEAELRSPPQNELSKHVLEQASLEFTKVSRWRKIETISGSKDLTLFNVTVKATERTRFETIGAPWYNQIQQLVGDQVCTLGSLPPEELTWVSDVIAHVVSCGWLKASGLALK